MNENVLPFNTQKNDKKQERILIVRLSEGSEVLEAASMDIDEKSENLSAKNLRKLATPFSHHPNSEIGRQSHTSGQILHRRKKRKTNWVRLLNIAFVVFVTLTAVIPALLSSALGIAIYAATSDAPDAKIFHGDLMLTKIMPANNLANNDVLLLHNDYTWNLEIRRVMDVSPVGDLVKITTSDGIDQSSTDAYTVKKSTSMHKVTRVVPMFGYWLKSLTSVPAKILGGVVVIAVNVVVQIRRSRKRRTDS